VPPAASRSAAAAGLRLLAVRLQRPRLHIVLLTWQMQDGSGPHRALAASSNRVSHAGSRGGGLQCLVRLAKCHKQM